LKKITCYSSNLYNAVERLWKFSFLHRCEILCEKGKERHCGTAMKIVEILNIMCNTVGIHPTYLLALKEGGCSY